jgi:hypothetical protein
MLSLEKDYCKVSRQQRLEEDPFQDLTLVSLQHVLASPQLTQIPCSYSGDAHPPQTGRNITPNLCPLPVGYL